MLILHVWLELKGWWLGAVVGAESMLAEDIEAMGMAGADELPLALDEVIEILDGTLDYLLKVQLWSMLLKFCKFLVNL